MKGFIERLYLASHDQEYDSLWAALKDRLLEIGDQVLIIGATLFLMNFILAYLPGEYIHLVSFVLGVLLGSWLIVMILKMMVSVMLAEVIEDVWMWINRNEVSTDEQ